MADAAPGIYDWCLDVGMTFDKVVDMHHANAGHPGIGLTFSGNEHSRAIFPKGIVINQQGRRIIAEDAYGSFAGEKVMQHDGAYLLADNALQNLLAAGGGFEPLASAATVEELAREFGIPASTLSDTLTYYNTSITGGEDPEWGKTAEYLVPLTTAPYHMHYFGPQATYFMTSGGLKINLDAQVINRDGPLPFRVLPSFSHPVRLPKDDIKGRPIHNNVTHRNVVAAFRFLSFLFTICNMRLFHGSYLAISKPRVDMNTRGLDFGDGFYLSTSFDQGKSFALRFTDQKRIERLGLSEALPTVSIYEFDLDAVMVNCTVRRFDCPSDVWFSYVVGNRNQTLRADDSDVVIGPIADDQVLTTIRLFENRIINQQEAIGRFMSSKLDDQVTIKTAKALVYLHFVEALVVGEES